MTVPADINGGPATSRMPVIFAAHGAPVPLRLPFDAPLPPAGPRRWAVIAALVVGGLVALLVPVVFAIVLFSLVWGG